MSQRGFYRLAGVALIAGGLLAAAAHVLHIEAPSDPAQLAHYAHLSQPIHLLLFAGGILVLLGWFGQFGLQSVRCGMAGLFAFLSLFLGILFADLLHCVLEFSIFPLLIASVPYATPAFAEHVYGSTPFAFLQNGGQILVVVGVPLSAFSIYRSRVLPRWAALPMAMTAVAVIMAFLPGTSRIVGPHYVIGLYLSLATLGVAILRVA
jgi:hypothetical protein